MGRDDQVLAFLNEHRGYSYCSGCLAWMVFDGKPPDLALRRLEGFGVERRHADCSACGKRRLVAGLRAGP